MSITYTIHYSGPLLFSTTITDEDLKNIKSLFNSKKDFRTSLAGDLKEQHQLDAKKLQLILNKYLAVHRQAHKTWWPERDLHSLKINSCWVNKMKAGEFNPPHKHDNCLYSSVIFLNDPPENIIAERKKYIGTNKGGPGSLNFMLGINRGHEFIEEKNHFPKKGDYFIFPATLYHYVFPYKSKWTRVSVAANYI